jgi:hypothetical protein
VFQLAQYPIDAFVYAATTAIARLDHMYALLACLRKNLLQLNTPVAGSVLLANAETSQQAFDGAAHLVLRSWLFFSRVSHALSVFSLA